LGSGPEISPLLPQPAEAFVSDRDAFREARDAGLKARHETREARAVRRDVANEIADAVADRQRYSVEELTGPLAETLNRIARIVREIGSRDPQ
jgi:hypothetical protein